MKVSVEKDYDQMSKRAAQMIAETIVSKTDAVLGLATGGTPEGCYAQLAQMHREEGLDFSRVTTFNLDEYLGLPPTHQQSYHRYIDERLFDRVNIDKNRTHIPDGLAPRPRKFCEAYERMIRSSGGIEVQVLGIGRNGHIGFNEPGSPFDSRTRVVDLSEETRKDNSRFFGSIDQVPRQAITMGLATIMEARRIVLLASGVNKARAVEHSVNGPVTIEVPASRLQRHRDCIFLLDEEAASILSKG
ncbi:MAG: glucosamine-6-phosphate deaminase [Nitrososphaeria archaeon]